tara:strand:- start:336 stop:503 length:168 start_codon:yes stop_codon:yes gene_type:complete
MFIVLLDDREREAAERREEKVRKEIEGRTDEEKEAAAFREWHIQDMRDHLDDWEG